jgi:putative transcriptional regulator
MGTDYDFDWLLGGLTEALMDPGEKTTLPLLPQTTMQVPKTIGVVAIRHKTGLAQAAFASRIGVPVGTVRNWEQGHRFPQGPARVLLDRNPRIVEEVLGR